MIDTHTHMYLPEFDADRTDAMTRARDAGVSMMVMPNVDVSTIEPMRALHAAYPACTAMAMGLHPTEVDDRWQENMAKIEAEFQAHRADYVAIGEVGIDLYWDATYRDRQMQILDRQCRMAVEAGLPVIIHCREGLDETLEVLSGYSGSLSGVMHSFGGTADDVERVRCEAGDFFFGINGIVTFKNSRLREVLPAIGLDRILLETDAPYLAPVPHRGKRNESAYVADTMRHIATSLGVDPTEVEAATDASAKALFKV